MPVFCFSEVLLRHRIFFRWIHVCAYPAVSNGNCRGELNTHFMSNTLFPVSLAVFETVELIPVNMPELLYAYFLCNFIFSFKCLDMR
jgi:hypothetical protein